MNSFTKCLVLTLSLAVISAVGGYWAGQKNAGLSSTTVQPVQQLLSNSGNAQSSKLFQNQTATVVGKITSVSDSSISAVDEKNQTDQFPLSKKWVVYKATSNQQNTPSSDVKSIEKDKMVLITLELIEGKYQVVAISYLPPAPEGPPPATPGAEAKR